MISILPPTNQPLTIHTMQQSVFCVFSLGMRGFEIAPSILGGTIVTARFGKKENGEERKILAVSQV
ncbi:hypothetical protein PanWU01x14_101560 [Parasponia andersonii]|uniref:Uncharacterized protein n=1 Tax=Parasponia andersonii TaxID=3476 RepID=A0A2P5D371_PARAD|nr:hypothetical protein PanWU01x14_101560 [Parasponia andersonii]